MKVKVTRSSGRSLLTEEVNIRISYSSKKLLSDYDVKLLSENKLMVKCMPIGETQNFISLALSSEIIEIKIVTSTFGSVDSILKVGSAVPSESQVKIIDKLLKYYKSRTLVIDSQEELLQNLVYSILKANQLVEDPILIKKLDCQDILRQYDYSIMDVITSPDLVVSEDAQRWIIDAGMTHLRSTAEKTEIVDKVLPLLKFKIGDEKPITVLVTTLLCCRYPDYSVVSRSIDLKITYNYKSVTKEITRELRPYVLNPKLCKGFEVTHLINFILQKHLYAGGGNIDE